MRMPPSISRRGPKRIDEPAGEESERERDSDLAVRVPRRDLLACPAKLLHVERVETWQAIEREADDREERQERGHDREDLSLPGHAGVGLRCTSMLRHRAPCARVQSRGDRRMRRVERVERDNSRKRGPGVARSCSR